MLLDYCIGKSAVPIKESYVLPVGEKLIQYDTIAVNTIVKNKTGERVFLPVIRDAFCYRPSPGWEQDQVQDAVDMVSKND